MKEKFDDNEIDSLFNEKLGKEELAPREIVWTRISHELGGDGGRKKPVAWIWWLSGIALVLTVGIWLGISTYNQHELAENKKGWNYKEPANGGFDRVPYESQGGDTGVILIEGGSFKKGNVDSSAQPIQTAKKENNSALNSGKKNVANNPEPLRPFDKLRAQGPGNKQPKENIPSTTTTSPGKKKSTYIPHENSSETSSGHKPVNDELNPAGSGTGIPHDISSPVAATGKKKNPSSEPVADSSLISKKTPDYFDTAKPIVLNPPPVYHAANPDSVKKADSIPAKNEPVAKSDSIPPKADTTATLPPALPPYAFPGFFITLHGGLDAGKIMKAEYEEQENSPTEVKVYNKNGIKSTPQPTYFYGLRFGKFVAKRISINLGAYYSIFETDGNQGNFRYNRNDELVFKMNTSTSSVNCSSSHFDYHDSNVWQGDTFDITVRSHEKYDYLSLQAGVAFYALRVKHFGIYGALYQNGSFLTKKYMEITVPKSGKEITWSGEKLTGMNAFVWNGQAALGFEWLPFGNFGLWFEPSYYFSAKLNTKNSVAVHPGGMKYLFGISYHF